MKSPDLFGPGKRCPNLSSRSTRLLHEIDADDIAAHEHVLRTGKSIGAFRILTRCAAGCSLFQIANLPGDFQPIIAYLVHRVEMQLGLSLLLSYDNRVKGMSEMCAARD